MTATVVDQAEKDHANLVEFAWGDPVQYARYTDWTSDVTLVSDVYRSLPTLELRLPANTATLDEQPCTIILPEDAFVTSLVSGHAHAPVRVRVSERVRSPTDPADIEVVERWRGRVVMGTRNWEDREGVAALECRSPKSELDSDLGVPEDYQCPWTLGDPLTCKLDLEALAQVGLVAAIDGSLVTITGLSPAPFARYWRRGSLRLDGLSISVRDWDDAGDVTAFHLVREPPPEWLGALVRVYPGDDNTIQTCRNFGNESEFGGAGHGMRDYNPNFETP